MAVSTGRRWRRQQRVPVVGARSVIASLLAGAPASDLFFFFNDTATTEIYTLSLHDALPISGAVGDEQVLHVVTLVPGVEHRGLGVAAHARRAHLVDRQPGRIVVHEWLHLLRPGGLQHLGRRDRHVLEYLALVVAPFAVDAKRRNAPGVLRVGVELDVVGGAGQALAEPVEREAPRRRRAQGALELGAEAGQVLPPGPTLAVCAALEAVAAQEVGVRGRDVAEARDVDPVGAATVDGPVFHARDRAARPAAHAVVHQVLAQLAARVGEPGGEARRHRIEEEARRFDRGRAQEDDARVELEGLAGLGVDDAHADGAVLLLVVDEDR